MIPQCDAMSLFPTLELLRRHDHRCLLEFDEVTGPRALDWVWVCFIVPIFRRAVLVVFWSFSSFCDILSCGDSSSLLLNFANTAAPSAETDGDDVVKALSAVRSLTGMAWCFSAPEGK